MQEDRSKIDELSKSLYSRDAPDVRTRRKLRFGDMVTDLKTDWDHKEEDTVDPKLNQKYEDNSMSFIKKLLIGSIIFCIVAVGIGTYLFLKGANLISGDNIQILINGPVSIPGGTPVSFDITVVNKNNIDLQLVDMTVDFPAGATDPNNPGRELTTYQELLGEIPAGNNVRKTIQAIIFGEENMQRQIAVNITYQVKGSSSSFTKKQTYDVLINSSPVNLSISSFKEITSGQPFDITLNVRSNTTETLKNIIVSATYPFGFTFISSDLKPLPSNSTWKLGDIPSGGQKTITIKGKLQGEDTDIRVFHFGVGAQSNKNPNVIGTEYMSLTQEVSIQKPFMSVTVGVNGEQGTIPAIGEFNQPARVEISLFNNLPTTVSGAEVRVKLAGSAYDRTLVQPGIGYYRSIIDEIIWNQQTIPQLASVGAGESNAVSFSITPRNLSVPNRPIVNPTLSFVVTVSGRRTQETGVPETLDSVISRILRVITNPTLSGRVVRSIGPFVNSGPIPPKADQKTTYTIIWTIDNTVNLLKDTKVTAILPPYVEWLGKFSPSTEDVTFSSSTNSITWNAGTVGTNTTYSGIRKELYFQIAVEPSISQVNNIPVIVNDATMTGTDDFTLQSLTRNQNYLTTRFSTDPSYKDGMETISR